MKAALCTQYGHPEVLVIADVPRPALRADEVLIRIHATTVTATDCLLRRGEPAWSRLILGIEMAGEGKRKKSGR